MQKKYKMFDSTWHFIRFVEAWTENAAIQTAENEGLDHYYLIPVME